MLWNIDPMKNLKGNICQYCAQQTELVPPAIQVRLQLLYSTREMKKYFASNANCLHFNVYRNYTYSPKFLWVLTLLYV